MAAKQEIKKHKKSPARDSAIAIKYDKEQDRAPRVVAKGQGFLARKIREIAKQSGVPIHQDDDLVEMLSAIEIEKEIPPELYAAVAEILSWIYRANTDLKKEISK
jgi:flagellar biosynthesis protein